MHNNAPPSEKQKWENIGDATAKWVVEVTEPQTAPFKVSV